MTHKTHGITVLVFVRNERENVLKLLPYLARYVSKFVFIDALSTDGTREICERYGIVYETQPIGFVEPCRMYGISKVSTEWIFYLDADEYPSRELLEALERIIQYANREGICAIKIRRVNFVRPGHALRFMFQPDYQVRIFRKNCVEYKGILHEQPQIKGKVLKLSDKYLIYHRAYNTYSIKAVKKLLTYARIAGMIRGGRLFSVMLLLVIPMTIACRLLKYLLLQRGILDGLAGLEAALVYTLYLTLVDIFKVARCPRFDHLFSYIQRGHDLNFLCKPIETN